MNDDYKLECKKCGKKFKKVIEKCPDCNIYLELYIPKHQLNCPHCGNDTFKVYWEVPPKHAQAVDQISVIVCVKCGKDSDDEVIKK